MPDSEEVPPRSSQGDAEQVPATESSIKERLIGFPKIAKFTIRHALQLVYLLCEQRFQETRRYPLVITIAGMMAKRAVVYKNAQSSIAFD